MRERGGGERGQRERERGGGVKEREREIVLNPLVPREIYNCHKDL